MEESETNSPQKWACSSLSSSDKFSSLHDRVLEGSAEWDQKSIESLVSGQSLQRSTVQPAVAKPRSKIIFPHIMTRGSVVGNKVYCKTSINNCFTWRPRCSTSLCASSSMLLTNFYHERSSDIQSGIAKIADEAPSSDPEENEKTELPRPLSSERCRALLLTVTGAAGMQLLFPSIRLPLLEVLLFSHQRWPTRRRRPSLASNGGGSWWRLPLNLALAISRPFYGSVLRRSLTAVLFLLQLRVRDKFGQRSARYMPDLNSVPSLEKLSPVDTDLNLSSKSSDNSSETEAMETLGCEPNTTSATCSEDGDNSLHAEEELIIMENDSSREAPPSLRAPQDVSSEDGLSSSGETWEQDVISDDGLSSSGDSVDDQDVISDGENSSISSSSLKDSGVEDYNLGHMSDDSLSEATEQSISQASHTAFSQPYDESPVASSATETSSSSSSSLFTSETCSSSDISTSWVGSDPYSGLLTSGENSEETSSSSDRTTSSSVGGDQDIVFTREDDSEETHSPRNISSTLSSLSAGSDTDSVATREEDSQEIHHTTLSFSTSAAAGSGSDSIVTTEDLGESRCTSVTSTNSVGADLKSVASQQEEEDNDNDIEESHPTLHTSTTSAENYSYSIFIPEKDREEISNIFTSSAGSDPDSVLVTPKEDSAEIVEKHSRLFLQQKDREFTTAAADIFPADVVHEGEQEVMTPSRATVGTDSCFPGEQQPPPSPPEIVDNALVENSAAVSSLDDQVLFPSSEEFQFHDDIPPSPSETSRSSPPSPGRLALFVSADETRSTPGSSKSVQMSPRADLTALMPEEYGCIPADGTWEIQVDRDELEVVWTPFKKRPVLVSDGEEDSSECSDESAADDIDSCKSAHGSQTGGDDDEEDDELFHEERRTRMMTIVQNAAADDGRPANSVQDRKFDQDCVQMESLGVDSSSVNRFSQENSESSRRLEEDARDEHACVPSSISTGRTTSDNEVARDDQDYEFQSVHGLRESEAAANAEVQRNKAVKAATPRLKLTIPLDAEQLSGLRGVILEHSAREAASTENSSTRGADDVFLHGRECTAVELLRSDDDCGMDVVKSAAAGNLSSLLVVVDSVREEVDRVRVPIVARVRAEETVESHLRRNKSLAVSVSSSSFVTAFGDDVDPSSPETPSKSKHVSRDSRSERSDASLTSTSSSVSSDACELFTDHPTCLHLRKVRHSHGDQVYLEPAELLSEPWRNLVYWHGRCREGRPTLVVLLGKAVSQLSAPELKHFITVTISHAEYAELNFFKGAVKQLNILMDLDGLGFMRLPPMHVLQSIGTGLNRDYAGRGGWIFLINAPMMLGLVISAMQRVILRPSYTKGAVIDKGFLEGKERIVTLGGRYKATLLKHFDEGMLPLTLGGACTSCSSETSQCSLGFGHLS